MNMIKSKYIWIIIFMLGFGLRSSYVFHPIDTISWRESDVASIAKNYYENGMDFFHPQINWGGTGPGFAEMEFPVYPYLIALSYKIFGFHEPAGRIISLIFSLAAMLVFFRLGKYLFEERTSKIVSLLFAISPLLNIVSDTIQPESVMFFFYIASVFTFLKWFENQSTKYFILAIFCIACSLLAKITAGHIGILFLLLILFQKNWKFLFTPKVLLFGFFGLVPAILWYRYSHNFYIQYGNSLGLSNEYAWIGFDFFTDPYFITGIIKNELHNIWMTTGPIILLLAISLTDITKKSYFRFAIFWLIAIFAFYIIASRTTADSWAYYYHIFSAPVSSILIGSSIVLLYDKYFRNLNLSIDFSKFRSLLNNSIVPLILSILIILQVAFTFRAIFKIKKGVFQSSEYYASVPKLSEIIPRNSIVLASGGICTDDKGYPVAFNSSYFFYWLNLKGFNICTAGQTLENVKSFADKGTRFFIAEKSALKQKEGFEETLNKNFLQVYNDEGLIVYKIK
jgi:4-amino-4-deoxy-L-arabinose transferase-like glycosyltransferase